MSSTYSMSGVYSGIDSDSIIEAAMAQEQTRLDNLEEKLADYETQETALDDIESNLEDLYDALDALSDIDTLRAVTVQSSDTDVVTVSADGATEGSHTIVVDQLATSERLVQTSTGLESEDSTVGAGTFSYTYDETTRTLTTSSTTTLDGLVDMINDDAGNPGITASVLEYNGEYVLVLCGNDVGADYTITIESTTTLDGYASDDFTVTQEAVNSKFKVDGFPTGDDEWIERSSNKITDAINGVTVTLQSTGSVTVTISNDTSALESNLNSLVTSYNTVVDILDAYTGYDEDSETGGCFQGDTTISSLLQSVRQMLYRPASGFDSDSDTYTLASQIGLEFDDDGYLALDSDDLNDAIDEDYDAILNLLAAADSGTTSSTDVQFSSAYQTTGGTYELEIDYDADGNISEARIRMDGQDEWRTMTVNGTTLTGVTGNAEQGMELTVVNSGTSQTKSYTVSVRQGLIGAMCDELENMLDETDGVFVVKNAKIDDQITYVEDKIEYQEDRMEDKQERLEAKYARLETTLAELDAVNSAYESLFLLDDSDDDSSS